MDSGTMISAYSKLAQRIWEDEDYKQRALDDPRAALAENGWELPGGTEVSLKMVQIAELPPAEDSNADRVIAEWRKGIEADQISIIVPSEPSSPEPQSISDEELSGVAGGSCACIGFHCSIGS